MPVNIKETPDRFAIEWTHQYRIDGSVMAFSDADGNTTAVEGYPVEEILYTARENQPALKEAHSSQRAVWRRRRSDE